MKGLGVRTCLVSAFIILLALLSATASAAPLAGDVNRDSALNAIDVQFTVNAVLGIDTGAISADIDLNGAPDAVDVQLVINAVLGIDIDADDDGLCDAAEARIGSDPGNPDSDGDGISDGQEVLNGTDPNQAGAYPPAAAFSGTPRTGAPPLTVSFTDLSEPGSSPITQWMWSFGDGDVAFTQSPQHTYAEPGAYDVSLTVTNAEGSNTFAVDNYILTEPAEVSFSRRRGFYTQAFSLTLTASTPDVEIRYTLDGSAPSLAHGTLYQDPLSIANTATVRAGAFKAGYDGSPVETHTYIFPAFVPYQSSGGGRPASDWPSGGVTGTGQLIDYGMDPAIVNDPNYAPLMVDALEALPNVSVVMDVDDLFDPATGIYVNAGQSGPGWERPASVELVDPDGAEGFQIDAGIRIRGNAHDSPDNPKHPFRLYFRSEYGPGKLEYPLFGEDGADEFDALDLRTSVAHSWAVGDGTLCTMNREVFSRDTQGDMGQPYTRSRYCHLYLNGQYWGVYQLQERPDADYGAEYFGGASEDYDAVNRSGALDGNLNAWQTLWEIASAGFNNDNLFYLVQGLNPDASPNPAYERMVDFDDLIDYLLAGYYAGALDGPTDAFSGDTEAGAFQALYNRAAPDGWKLFAHDYEASLLDVNENRTGPFTAGETIAEFNGQWLHQRLAVHPEYRVHFADIAHARLFNDGALTPDAAASRFQARASELELPIVAESARWGDASPARGITGTFTRDNHWQPLIDALTDTYFPSRTGIVVSQLRARGWYPAVDAPVFYIDGVYQHGGTVDGGSVLTMGNPNGSGQIYYTLDGTDPRQPYITTETSEITLVSEAAPKRVLVPAGDLGDAWQQPGYNDSSWTAGTGGVGYEVGAGYASYFDIDVRSQMYLLHGSCYVRVPFTVDATELGGISSLTLKMRYDDGFVAYLNGEELVRVNAPTLPAWNSFASAPHDDGEAVTQVTFSVTESLSELQAGDNVLAIHGLNLNTASSDFLISPELLAGATVPSGGEVAAGALGYGGGVTLDRSVQVKARVLDNGAWSALNEAVYIAGALAPSLRISEIMYHPVNPDAEFVELTNVGGEPINLAGLAFTAGIGFTFPDIQLGPGDYVVIVLEPVAFETEYGTGINVAGQYTGRLDNAGEQLVLKDATGTVLFDFEYKDGWYPITDGGGFSLTAADPANTGSGAWGDPASWRPSALSGGSPGEGDGGAPAPGSVLINEVLAHSHAAAPDWVELYNPTSQPANIGGWVLSDDEADLMKFEIAPGTAIPAGGYLVFNEEEHFGNPANSGAHTPFALSENGESLHLRSAAGGELTGYSEEVSFGASDTGVAFGRYMTSTGDVHFVPMSVNTPGSVNAYPKVGPVVINELMYNPILGGEEAEYVELRNVTGLPVLLESGEGVPWRFTEGIVFEFPAGESIPANGYVVVAKDPAIFDTLYTGVPAPVEVFGPYEGNLRNSGETVVLSMPGDVDELMQRQYIAVDRVDYGDGGDWPPEPDGGGSALKRIVPADYGDDVANWEAAAPTPGE